MAADSEVYKKGEAIRRRLMGEAAFKRRQAEYHSDPVMTKFIDLATETVFGSLWTRPGLDIKTRTLICVVSDAATGRHPELDIHLRFALKQGWTEDELTEVLSHLTGYVGVPIIREAMLVASRILAETRRGRQYIPPDDDRVRNQHTITWTPGFAGGLYAGGPGRRARGLCFPFGQRPRHSARPPRLGLSLHSGRGMGCCRARSLLRPADHARLPRRLHIPHQTVDFRHGRATPPADRQRQNTSHHRRAVG